MIQTPPKWANRFLEWFCNPDLLEDLQGDLYEMYEHKSKESVQSANFHFVWLVLRSIRYSVIQRNYQYENNLFAMTSNNFKIATRVLWHDKFNTGINLIGLTIGITCFILVGFYVQRELSFDRFHSKSDNIYRVWLKEVYAEDKIFFNSETPLRFETLLENNFDEIEFGVQFDLNNYLVGTGEDRTDETVGIISPEFFDVFDFNISSGNTETPLPDKNSIVLSENYAIKYFGGKSAVGGLISIQIGEELREFSVSAVFENIRESSSIQFDMAFSNENNLDLYGERAMNAWFSISPETYVLVKENSSISTVEEKLPELVMSLLEGRVEPGVYNIGFQPLTDIHLNSEIPPGIAPVGDKDSVYILGFISILVLVIACINYTTLSIGQSLKRSKEVGIRKVMGAFRSTLISQYITESMLITMIAMIAGIGFAFISVPAFNSLTGAGISLDFQPWHLGLYSGLALVIGISSGIYPAFVLSRLKVVTILRGSNLTNKNHFRKGMVVFQFFATVFLISSTLIMNKQLDYIHSKDLGYNYNTVVVVPLYPDPSSQRLSEFIGSAMEKGNLLKYKLEQYPSISDIGMGSHVFGTAGWGKLSFTDDNETFRQFRLLTVDPFYLNTFQIKMKLGRSFKPESTADEKEAIILNQAAVEYFGLKDPLNAQLPSMKFGEHQIIGVTEDFNFSSLHNEVDPLIITQNINILYPAISDHDYIDSPVPKLVFRYKGTQLTQLRTILETEWKSTFPEEDLNLGFVEENMQFLYENEQRTNQLVLIVTVISIIIASLGLLGLTVLVINSRVKEMGIRKVVGASDTTIFGLLARSFSLQLGIGILLSIPVTYWMMEQWLSDFAFQIPLSPWLFIVSAIISIVIALIAISYHAVKAATVNPVDSLRMG